jgi:hypothetical protein
MQFRAVVGDSGVAVYFLSFVLPDAEVIGFGSTAFRGVADSFAYFLEVEPGLAHLPHGMDLFGGPGDATLFQEFVDAHSSSAHIW